MRMLQKIALAAAVAAAPFAGHAWNAAAGLAGRLWEETPYLDSSSAVVRCVQERGCGLHESYKAAEELADILEHAMKREVIETPRLFVHLGEIPTTCYVINNGKVIKTRRFVRQLSRMETGALAGLAHEHGYEIVDSVDVDSSEFRAAAARNPSPEERAVQVSDVYSKGSLAGSDALYAESTTGSELCIFLTPRAESYSVQAQGIERFCRISLDVTRPGNLCSMLSRAVHEASHCIRNDAAPQDWNEYRVSEAVANSFARHVTPEIWEHYVRPEARGSSGCREAASAHDSHAEAVFGSYSVAESMKILRNVRTPGQLHAAAAGNI